jgi:hypothetical protein
MYISGHHPGAVRLVSFGKKELQESFRHLRADSVVATVKQYFLFLPGWFHDSLPSAFRFILAA